MKIIKEVLIPFIKKEIVLSIAIILMIATCFIIPIDKEYLNYFDSNTLISLFCMLAVIAGLKSTNIFELISRKLISLFHTRRSVISVNVGSLGIIISSLASLITLKEFLKHQPKNFWKYLGIFTIVNTIFLSVLLIITRII